MHRFVAYYPAKNKKAPLPTPQPPPKGVLCNLLCVLTLYKLEHQVEPEQLSPVIMSQRTTVSLISEASMKKPGGLLTAVGRSPREGRVAVDPRAFKGSKRK